MLRLRVLLVLTLWGSSASAQGIEKQEDAPADASFHARLGLGVGGGLVTSHVRVPTEDWKVEYQGAGWVFDVMAGVTIDDWLILGGGLWAMAMGTPSVEAEPGRVILPEALTQGGFGMATLGPVVDVFFGPGDVAYVGAIGGLAGIGLEDKSGDWSRGWSIGLHGGYDVWVSDAWTVGLGLRYLYAHATRTVSARPATTAPGPIDAEAEDSGNTFGLLFNLAYR